MFPNAMMMKPQTWNDILAAMIAVRDAHGWKHERIIDADVPQSHSQFMVCPELDGPSCPNRSISA